MSEFNRLSGELARALVYGGGEYTLEDIRAEIEQGTMQFWPGQHSVVVTEILQRPRTKVLYFFLAAGDMDEVKRLYHVILEWGRAQGCTRASFAGRYGWGRTFLTREEGWTSQLALYEKELANG